MSQWRDRLRNDRVRKVVEKSTQVVIMAGLVGAVTGFGVAAFERIVVSGLLNHINDLPLWVVTLAPTCGLLLALGALHIHRRGDLAGDLGRVPQVLPRPRGQPVVARPRRAHRGVDRHSRLRRRDGARRPVPVSRGHHRSAVPAQTALVVPFRGSSPSHGGRRRRRRCRDLQSACHRRDLRDRGAVSRRARAAHAPSRSRVGRNRVPRVRRDQRHRPNLPDRGRADVQLPRPHRRAGSRCRRRAGGEALRCNGPPREDDHDTAHRSAAAHSAARLSRRSSS